MNYLSIEDSIKYEYYIDRLTFNQRKILLEVNLFNFSGNLYNKKLIVES